MILNVKAILDWGHVDRFLTVDVNDGDTLEDLEQAVATAYEEVFDSPLGLEFVTNGDGHLLPRGADVIKLFADQDWVLVKGTARARSLAAPKGKTPRKRAGTTLMPAPKSSKRAKAAAATPSKTKAGSGKGTARVSAAVVPCSSQEVSLRRTGASGPSGGAAEVSSGSWKGPTIKVRRVVPGSAGTVDALADKPTFSLDGASTDDSLKPAAVVAAAEARVSTTGPSESEATSDESVDIEMKSSSSSSDDGLSDSDPGSNEDETEVLTPLAPDAVSRLSQASLAGGVHILDSPADAVDAELNKLPSFPNTTTLSRTPISQTPMSIQKYEKPAPVKGGSKDPTPGAQKPKPSLATSWSPTVPSKKSGQKPSISPLAKVAMSTPTESSAAAVPPKAKATVTHPPPADSDDESDSDTGSDDSDDDGFAISNDASATPSSQASSEPRVKLSLPKRKLESPRVAIGASPRGGLSLKRPPKKHAPTTPKLTSAGSKGKISKLMSGADIDADLSKILQTVSSKEVSKASKKSNKRKSKEFSSSAPA